MEWETIDHKDYGYFREKTERMRVTGGMLYRSTQYVDRAISQSMVFVPLK